MSRTRDYRAQSGYMLTDRDGTGLSESMERYIATVYLLSAEVIRVNNLAVHLRTTPSEVTRIAEQLGRMGLVEFQRYGFIRLTDEGKRTGAFLLWRHDTVKRLFKLINGSRSDTAEAERAEHLLSPATIKSIEMFLDGQEAQ